MKKDPYKHKEIYLNWKEKVGKNIPGLGKNNSKLLLKYLEDMEIGRNVGNGSVKGSRSYLRLVALKNKLIFVFNKAEELFKINDIRNITEHQIHQVFSGMGNGTIKRKDGKVILTEKGKILKKEMDGIFKVAECSWQFP